MNPCFKSSHRSNFDFCGICSQLGDDDFGHMLSDILKQNKVDNSGVRFDSTARTALAFITLRDDGEREFLFFRHPSADMLLQESELDINLLEQVYFFLLVLVRNM